jgi:hypothetical protein
LNGFRVIPVKTLIFLWRLSFMVSFAVNKLEILEADQRWLRQKFDDNRIIYGRNPIKHRFEVWYKPESTRPYMITVAENVSHARRLLENRMKYDKFKATEVLKQIDEFNQKLLDDKQKDAAAEVRATMQSVACGRQHFILR